MTVSPHKHVWLWCLAGTVILLLQMLATPARGLAMTGEEQSRVALCQKLNKGVVNISSTTLSEDFFLSPLPHKGSASGFLVDGEGHVVTNLSLLSDVHALEVTLYDGQKWPATLLGSDPETDIAVLGINCPEETKRSLAPLPLGATSSLQPGQTVIALGNPFGQGPSISAGTLGTPRRTLRTPEGRVVDDVIETNLTIHAGNAGGPLIDTSGRVIGIDTLIFTPNEVPAGVGFAIASETLGFVASQIISQGYVVRGWIGATFQTITPALARVLNLPVEHGAMIIKVSDKGPAVQAGLQPCDNQLRLGNQWYSTGGDVVVAVDSQPVQTAGDVVRLLRGKKPGTDVTLSLYRGKLLKRVKVQLGSRQANPS